MAEPPSGLDQVDGLDALDAHRRAELAQLVAKVEREILAGLPNEKARRDAARIAGDYFHLRNEAYIPRREAEDEADYLERRKQVIPFARRVVRSLTKHLYQPGPGRQIEGDAATTTWLDGVYSDNLISSLWQRADAYAHLGGASAFQAAATGDPRRPIRLHLWRAEELAVYPDTPEPSVVVTVDCEDNQRTYTLWTADEYRVYRTPKFNGDTAGSVLPRRVAGEGGENPYGTLPFAFVHADLPTSSFWEGNLGDYLVHANAAADDQLSDLAHAIKKFQYPIGVAENCGVEFQVTNKFGAFVRLMSAMTGMDSVPPAKLSYLQATLDVVGTWEHIERSLYTALDCLEIPRAAFRMDAPAAPSGVAILAEQLPLVERAKERREAFRRYEQDLARVCLLVAAAYYRRAELATAAEDLSLILTWPEQTNPLPGQERDASDQAAMDMGLTSRVMLLQERYGLSRDQAIARLKQIAKDKAEAEEIDPTPDPMAGFGGEEDPDRQEPDRQDPAGPRPGRRAPTAGG